MNSKYKAVFFDFDGTIADTGDGIFHSVKYAIKESGYPPISDESLRTFIGPPVFDSFKRELGIDEEQSAFAVMKYREEYSREGIFRFTLYDGIQSLLKELKKHEIQTAIASSKPYNFILRIIDYLNFGDLIDFISCPLSDKAHESKVILVSRCVEHFEIKKNEAIMVGDRHFDINGAKGAGVESIGVTFGYGDEKELSNAGATHIAHNVDEIRNIIFF
ncbi:MAG: HAD hydrolase-like protein [Clostridia bacterium]|nr:HAD hydrolase-like protein [Clostridia bacterium]